MGKILAIDTVSQNRRNVNKNFEDLRVLNPRNHF